MRKLWFFCIFILVACGGPSRATPAATPFVIDVAYTPSMLPYTKVLHTCASAHTEFMVNVYAVPTLALDTQTTDLVIQLGGTTGKGYAAPIGEETIVLIMNTDNPVMSISAEKIQAIFSGSVTNWADVGGEQQAIQVWAYPDGDDVRDIFDAAIFQGHSLTPNALIAPDPQAMLEAVNDDPLAIGYVPQTWLVTTTGNEHVRSLNSEQKLVEKLHQPVLIRSRTEPVGALRQLVVCLQSTGK